jgi:hypothetical protein
VRTSATALPVYTWNAVSNATHYYLYVYRGTTTLVFSQALTSAQANCSTGTGRCSFTPSVSLKNTAHTWLVRTYNGFGYGPYSARLSFTVSAPPPLVTLVSPSGTIRTTRPTYYWNAVANATRYYLQVDSTGIWVSTAQAHCPLGTGRCYYASTTILRYAAHRWMVRPNNEKGYGPWSSPLNFTVTR